MPVYDYLCDNCGPFTAMRPMAEFEKPLDCPECAKAAPRAILRAPHFALMASEKRLAHATNERSAHAPRTLSSSPGTLSPAPLSSTSTGHGAGCACCSTSMRKAKRRRSGAKSFPGSRPWMISH